MGVHINREPVHFLTFLDTLKGFGDQVLNLLGSLDFFLLRSEDFQFNRILEVVALHRIFLLSLRLLLGVEGFHFLKDIVLYELSPFLVLLLFAFWIRFILRL